MINTESKQNKTHKLNTSFQLSKVLQKGEKLAILQTPKLSYEKV